MFRGVPREQIAELVRQGVSDTAVSRQLGCDRHRVGDIRRDLNLPRVPVQPLSLEEKWRTNTRPLDSGHLAWTGERQSTSGTPIMRYREVAYSPCAIAFRIKHGREPQGYVFADCGLKHCVSPEHVDDDSTRQQTREQLRYVTGMPVRKKQCRHGHDQAVHGAYEGDGRAYCRACKRNQR